MRGRGWCGKTT